MIGNQFKHVRAPNFNKKNKTFVLLLCISLKFNLIQVFQFSTNITSIHIKFAILKLIRKICIRSLCLFSPGFSIIDSHKLIVNFFFVPHLVFFSKKKKLLNETFFC